MRAIRRTNNSTFHQKQIVKSASCCFHTLTLACGGDPVASLSHCEAADIVTLVVDCDFGLSPDAVPGGR